MLEVGTKVVVTFDDSTTAEGTIHEVDTLDKDLPYKVHFVGEQARRATDDPLMEDAYMWCYRTEVRAI